MIKENKGQSGLFDVFIVMIMAIVVLVFFALYKYGFGLLTNTLTAIQTPANSLNLNVSLAASQTFGQVNSALSGLHLIAFVIIFGMLISILLHNFLVKVNPAFIILYILLAIVAIIVSFYISNTYQTLLVTPTIGGALIEFTAGTFIMVNLPIWIAVISLLGGAFLVFGIINNRPTGGFR